MWHWTSFESSKGEKILSFYRFKYFCLGGVGVPVKAVTACYFPQFSKQNQNLPAKPFLPISDETDLKRCLLQPGILQAQEAYWPLSVYLPLLWVWQVRSGLCFQLLFWMTERCTVWPLNSQELYLVPDASESCAVKRLKEIHGDLFAVCMTTNNIRQKVARQIWPLHIKAV